MFRRLEGRGLRFEIFKVCTFDVVTCTYICMKILKSSKAFMTQSVIHISIIIRVYYYIFIE